MNVKGKKINQAPPPRFPALAAVANGVNLIHGVLVPRIFRPLRFFVPPDFSTLDFSPPRIFRPSPEIDWDEEFSPPRIFHPYP